MEREQRIRERAHAIWEREGRPDGREREHWEQAAAEIDAESGSGATAGEAGGSAATERKPSARGKRGSGAAAEKPATRGKGASGAAAEDTSATAKKPATRGKRGSAASADEPAPGSGVGSASPLQPSGTTPGGSPAAGAGSMGTGGGSTAGKRTGSAGKSRK